MKRICDSYSGLKNIEFSQEWVDSLSEYMELAAVSQLPGRRNVRKLLLYLAGSRENYRKLRDLNVYNTNLQVNYFSIFMHLFHILSQYTVGYAYDGHSRERKLCLCRDTSR